MDRVITALTAALPPVAPSLLREAAAAGTELAEHHRLAAAVEALHAVEVRSPPPGAAFRLPQRIAAWNLERVLHPEASAALLRAAGAEVVLLTEVDVGLARSGNRHNAAEIADRLGMGYAYGVEFVELTRGGTLDDPATAHIPDTRHLHGNAILSRAPLHDVRLIRLDDGGFWFNGRRGQKRLGWRMALAARLGAGADALVVASVHLESAGDADGRAEQMRRLVSAIEDFAAGAPVVIGGDLNTNALPQDARAGDAWFDAPETAEPLFAVMRGAGYAYAPGNTAATTQRIGTTGKPVGYRRLDWFFTRGVAVGEPDTVPALAPDGTVLTDHELILLTAGQR